MDAKGMELIGEFTRDLPIGMTRVAWQALLDSTDIPKTEWAVAKAWPDGMIFGVDPADGWTEPSFKDGVLKIPCKTAKFGVYINAGTAEAALLNAVVSRHA